MPIKNRSSNNHGTRTFTLDTLTNALEQVQALHEISADLIAENVFGQPPQQHQGEPVAWLVKCKQSGLVEQADPNEKANNPAHWTDAFPVYTHADPGEVERLRAELRELRESMGYRSSLVGRLEQERDTLHAQMAERDALLVDIRLSGLDDERCARIDLLLSSGAYANAINKHPLLRTSLDNAAIEVFLSASAEPSAPVEKIKLYLNVSNVHVTINPDGSYTIDPVQIDERAEFEKWWSSRTSVDPYTKGEHWDAWQARAALERKP